jgi:hypothetical protein
MLLPRLAGIAEKGWSDAQVSSWADHRARLAVHGRLWTQDGLTYFQVFCCRLGAGHDPLGLARPNNE